MFFSYVVLKWKDNRWLYKAPCCFMWVSWDTSSQTDWPAGSSSHPCYLTIIRQEGGSVWESPRSVHPQVFCICRKPDVFNAPVVCFVFQKRKWLNVVWVWLFVSVFKHTLSSVSEIEAKEACDWLRAAGFPQYAQLFEGNKSTQWTPTNIYHKEGKCCLVKG